MGREIRRVPPNWEHPQETKWHPFKRIEQTDYKPLYDRSYGEEIAEWIANHQLWLEGKHEDQKDGGCAEYKY